MKEKVKQKYGKHTVLKEKQVIQYSWKIGERKNILREPIKEGIAKLQSTSNYTTGSH